MKCFTPLFWVFAITGCINHSSPVATKPSPDLVKNFAGWSRGNMEVKLPHPLRRRHISLSGGVTGGSFTLRQVDEYLLADGHIFQITYCPVLAASLNDLIDGKLRYSTNLNDIVISINKVAKAKAKSRNEATIAGAKSLQTKD